MMKNKTNCMNHDYYKNHIKRNPSKISKKFNPLTITINKKSLHNKIIVLIKHQTARNLNR